MAATSRRTAAPPLLLLPLLLLVVADTAAEIASVTDGSPCRTRQGEFGVCTPLYRCRHELWRLPTPCTRRSICCPTSHAYNNHNNNNNPTNNSPSNPTNNSPNNPPSNPPNNPTNNSPNNPPSNPPNKPTNNSPTNPPSNPPNNPPSTAPTTSSPTPSRTWPPQTTDATTTTQRIPRSTTPKVLTKSQQKCEEWGQAVFRLEVSPVLLDDAPPINRSLCGGEGTPYIIGGVPAEPTEFPHMAAVGFGPESSVQFLCGGSLISERWVLTAAHCLDDYTNSGIGPPRWVRLGDMEPEGEGDHMTAQDFTVEKRVWHPDYQYPLKDHDLGLLRLDDDAEFNEFVRPACLSWRMEPQERKAIVTGWGKTEKAGYSESLLKVELPLTEQAKCVSVFAELKKKSPSYGRVLPNGVTDSMLCAGEPEGGKDSCQGDSGGPLQVRNAHPYCTYSILGIVSFGKGCAEPGYPAIYTRVASYVPWIESVVWP